MNKNEKIIVNDIYKTLSQAVNTFLIHDWPHKKNIKTEVLTKEIKTIGENLIELAQKLEKNK